MSRYLNLVADFVRRDLKKQYSGSVLGIGWIFLNPFFQIAIYTTIFGIFFKARPYVRNTEVPYILFLCTALIPWNIFQATFHRCVHSFLEHAEYIKKLDLSKHLFLVYPLVSSLIPFFSLFIMLLIIFRFFGTPLDPFGILLYIFIHFLFLSFLFGLTLALSPITVFIKDISHFLPYILQTIFWVTPITYDTTILPTWALRLLKFNPFFYFMDAFRVALLGNPMEILTKQLPFCIAVAILSCSIGYYIYHSLNNWVADEL